MPNDEQEEKTVEVESTQILADVPLPKTEAQDLESKRYIRVKEILSSVLLIAFGALSLAFSILNESQILAFVGLGLTFWGVLFLFIRSRSYVERSLLDSAMLPTYATIDRILKELKPQSNAYYIPPLPEANLPTHLGGLKDMVVFVSAEKGATAPSIDELAKGKFIIEKPHGICISPPGLGLLSRMENLLKADFTTLRLPETCESLSEIVVQNLQLAKELQIQVPTKLEERQIYVKTTGSVYKNLYQESSSKSLRFLGCPLTSAIACALAKSTGLMVTIQKLSISQNGQTIETWYRLVEAQ